MTDTNAPERIWVTDLLTENECIVLDECEVPDPLRGDIEYIRADLATPALREDGYSAGVRAALEAAARLAERGMMSVDGGQARVEILSLAGALLDAPALPEARAGAVEPVAWLVVNNGKRKVVDATRYNPSKPSFWFDAAAMEAATITPLYAAPPTPACTATDGPASACVYRAPGLGMAADWERG